MGNCFSSRASFTLTSSYLTTANGRPMSVTFHPPQQIPTSLSSGNDIPPSKPSPPRRGRGKRTYPPSRNTTLSPQPGRGNIPRARSQDSHRDTTERTPPSFRSDVPTSPSHSRPPAGLGAPLHQYQSRGGESSGPSRSRSFDPPSRQRSPAPAPHRMASASSLDGRRSPRPNVEPVLSQDDLPTPWSNQNVPVKGSDDRQCLESTLQSILRDNSRY
jgi:hypothetical protein